MSLRIRTSLGSLTAGNNKPVYSSLIKPRVGRVYGVITTENTPTKKQFEKYGGFSAVGTVLYLDYETNKNTILENTDEFFDKCSPAKPVSTDIDYPLVGELIYIQSLPSANSQENSVSVSDYYTEIINIWNNSQHNAQPAGDKYNFKTFVASENTKNLLRFEGDKIIQGRKGNSIRFGSTVKDKINLNEWSLGPGEDGDPLMILSNGQNINPDTFYHIEKVNEEYSSIYFTSTQKIPLLTDKSDVLNPLTNPIKVSDYYRPQIIANADRIVINSKKDDVLIFATTNIELNTRQVINLNSDNRVHINSPRVMLGTSGIGELPTEPLVLGNELQIFLSNLLKDLSAFCSELSSAKSMAEGADLIQIQAAATAFNSKLISQYMSSEVLNKLVSKQNYTI